MSGVRGSVERPAELGRRIAAAAHQAGTMLLCSDFDGTLAPIVAQPADAHPLPAAIEALDWLSRAGAATATPGVRLAVVTARDADDLAARLPLGPEAVIVGCAGLERRVEGRTEVHPEALAYLPHLEEAQGLLADALAGGGLPGVRLERKRCGVVLHTRGAHRPGVEAEADELAAGVARRLGLRAVRGKRAVEMRPPVDLDKASAVADLLAEGAAGSLLVAAGDDLPDVAMLRAAATRPDGIAVAVADAETPEIVVEAATDEVEGPWAWAETLRAVVAGLRQRAAVPPGSGGPDGAG